MALVFLRNPASHPEVETQGRDSGFVGPLEIYTSVRWAQNIVDLLVGELRFLLDELANCRVLERNETLHVLGHRSIIWYTIKLADDIVLATALVAICLVMYIRTLSGGLMKLPSWDWPWCG